MHLFSPSLDIFCEIKIHGVGHDPLKLDDDKKIPGGCICREIGGVIPHSQRPPARLSLEVDVASS